MTRAEDARTQLPPDFNRIISNVLRYGVIISVALIAFGTLLILFEHPAGFPSAVGQVVSLNYGRATLSLVTLLRGVASLHPIYVIQLGLIALLATPIVRVIASILLFARENDVLYAGITALVLLILVLSIFLVGPLIGSVGQG